MRIDRSEGFTLIELMIVIVIIGLLAAVAYPAYTEHVQKGERARVKAFMLDVALKEERYYSGAGAFCFDDTDCPWLVQPDNVHRYTVTVANAIGADKKPIPSVIEITATPTADSPDTVCGALKLTNTLVKTSETSNPLCWSKGPS
jgi:type IV pilus assembly protein PilE